MSRAILAGMASGSLMGVLFLGVGAAAAVSHPSITARLAARLSSGTGPFGMPALAVALATGLAWMVVGALFGLLYYASTQMVSFGGLGSPNALYTAGVLGLSGVAIAFAALCRRAYVREAIIVVAGFAAIFGWLLPWLAV